eukprot:TRINITY_DN16952_c0_g1_i1.p1 TRINITY_DN16952_c0_g1~~TRINITY_DN16952_c0_g1_i1.p1  ORF type:complete len:616 (-),score=61.40 TRINITY_DN16952_c0_g1_i1:1543-3390(-)
MSFFRRNKKPSQASQSLRSADAFPRPGLSDSKSPYSSPAPLANSGRSVSVSTGGLSQPGTWSRSSDQYANGVRHLDGQDPLRRLDRQDRTRSLPSTGSGPSPPNSSPPNVVLSGASTALIPHHFLCPMSLEIMVHPVVLESGHSFERAYIEQWFSLGNNTCPTTNQKLLFKTLVPNLQLEKTIQAWCAENNYELPRDVVVKQVMRQDSMKQRLKNGRDNGSEERRQRIADLRNKLGYNPMKNAEEVLRNGTLGTPSPPQSSSDIRGLSPPQQSVENSPHNARASSASFYLPNSRDGVGVSPEGHRTEPIVATPVSPKDEKEDLEPLILDQLQRLDSDQLSERIEAAMQLRAIARASSEGRELMARLRAIPTLLKVVQDADEDGTVVEHAVTALYNMSTAKSLQVPLAHMTVTPLLGLVGNENQSITARENATATLSNLYTHEKNRSNACALGVVPVLATLFRNGPSKQCKHDAAICLYNLAIDMDCRHAILDLGMLRILIDDLGDENGALGRDSIWEELVLMLMSALLKSRSAVDEIIEDPDALGNLSAVMEGGATALSCGHALACLLLVAESGRAGLLAVKDAVILVAVQKVAEHNSSRRAKEKAKALIAVLRA